MTDATAEFFEGLGWPGHDPRLENVSGSIRFDLTHDHRIDHWYVEIDDGDLRVSRDGREADCVAQFDKAVFDRIVKGEASVRVGWLRNEVKISGRLELLVIFERLLPGPPGALDPRQVMRTGAAARRRLAGAGGEEMAGRPYKFHGILESNTFVVSHGSGDMSPSPSFPTGFFSFDTRFLSTWHLSVNGQRLHALSVDDLQYFETRYFLVPGAPTHYVDAKLSVIRQHSVGGSFDEQLTVLNHDTKAVDVRVRIDIGSDFADISEIMEVQKKGRLYAQVEDGRLRLGYEREYFRRETLVSSTEPAQIDERGMTFDIRIESHREWSTGLHVATLGADGRDLRAILQGQPSRPKPQMRQDQAEWLDRAPTLKCDSELLRMTYQRSLVDLGALRYRQLTVPGAIVVTAGLPWRMNVHARDTILASLQTLPFAPQFAAGAMLLALYQGRKLDDFRDEEPGKIYSEFRLGESAAFEEQPHTFYYGSADTTPLWLILLDEHERWTGDDTYVRRFEPEARRCLAWIDTYADAVGNGYIWYQRRNSTTGVENQCWKDSWNAITYRDGSLPDFPRATCEIQGYAYDAKIRAARLAREFWQDPGYADQLEREAADLKERFNRDFWVEDGEYYALALDPDGRQVDALASNIGHLLWSGIVTPDRAKKLAEHLLGPRLFSGWGVRTLATDMGEFNPVGRHTGTVSPFDNSFIAWGLCRYGFTVEAGRIATAIIDASKFFRNRLPEAFAGYDRELTKYPVHFPNACSPFALSAGTPLLLLRTLLGLNPEGERLTVEPALPEEIGNIELRGILGRWGRVDAHGRGKPEK